MPAVQKRLMQLKDWAGKTRHHAPFVGLDRPQFDDIAAILLRIGNG